MTQHVVICLEEIMLKIPPHLTYPVSNRLIMFISVPDQVQGNCQGVAGMGKMEDKKCRNSIIKTKGSHKYWWYIQNIDKLISYAKVKISLHARHAFIPH